MNIVKMTRNGQVTIPANMRKQFETSYYICELKNGSIVFQPVKIEEASPRKKVKYTMEDLKNWSFESKDPSEKNLGGKIDQIL